MFSPCLLFNSSFAILLKRPNFYVSKWKVSGLVSLTFQTAVVTNCQDVCSASSKKELMTSKVIEENIAS